jgi:hypothetical protein
VKQSDIKERINKVDVERLEGYMRMFDRILLYNLAANVMHPDTIKDIVGFWEKAVKQSIDTDCQKFTTFLQSTPQGRLASLTGTNPDGEDMRLRFLGAFDVAHEIISANTTKLDIDDNFLENEI